MSSPGVSTYERDLTFVTQSVTTNSSGAIGAFTWGPVNQVTQVSNENQLLAFGGRPDLETSVYFHSIQNYMLYASPVLVVRAVGVGALNAVSSGDPMAVLNDQDYEMTNLEGVGFIGRYPGNLVNGVTISAADETNYDTWAWKGSFSLKPTGDQFNLVVIDTEGKVTGNKNSVIERYELLTKTPGSKRTNGTSAYVKKVISSQSNYVLVGDVDVIDFTDAAFEVTLTGGVSDNDPANIDFASAAAVFADKETVKLTRTFDTGLSTSTISQLIDIADTRGDSIMFYSPQLSDIYNVRLADGLANVLETFGSVINRNTSYSFRVDNWKLVYDKYNDTNVYIPCSSDSAALHARVFVDNEPWVSPAGMSRGQVKNVIRLAWYPDQATRDALYDENINSIVSFQNEGTVLWGDKTGYKAASAFAFINVRSLLIVAKAAISRSARYQLFEFNDTITRTVFRNATNQYLDGVKSGRGITKYQVVCDETNNGGQVIDAGEFVGDIYLRPNRSIQNIRLNFIAVGASVTFEEVEG